MTLYSILRAAEEMEVDPRQAALRRISFLQDEILVQKGLIHFGKFLMSRYSKRSRTEGEMTVYMAKQALPALESEVQNLLDYLNGKKKAFQADAITPEMIERARNYQIADLIDQKPKGASKVVCCPFHKDKGPSASVKNNVLFCFAGCRPKNEGRKAWDPILLLMERDGMSFPAAVKALQ